MSTSGKIPVLNPLTLRNTVGAELIDIFEANGIENGGDILQIENLQDKETLSSEIMQKASEILGLDGVVEYMSNFQRKYLEEKPKYEASYKRAMLAYDKLKIVLPLLRGEFTDGYDVLDDILDFFGVNSEKEIFEASEKQAALFRAQTNTKIDPISLYGWLRRGELDFNALSLPMYDEKALMEWIDSREWADRLNDIDYFESLPGVFSRFGVGLVFVPALPETVYGAIRWVNGKPLIQISDTDIDPASCWFTLFHELGHAIRHKDMVIYEGGAAETGSFRSRYETEANDFAKQYL